MTWSQSKRNIFGYTCKTNIHACFRKFNATQRKIPFCQQCAHPKQPISLKNSHYNRVTIEDSHVRI